MSIVIELQRAAQNDSVRVSTLLRRALVVARKLDVTDIEDWIANEMNGYASDVPPYRVIPGRVSVRNPFHGWQPVVFSNAEMAETCSKRALGDAVPKLETYERGAPMGVSLPEDIKQDLMKWMSPVPLEPVFLIDYSAIAGVLDAVRNRILEWSLQLERDGIMGEDDTFSPEEKSKAVHNVQNFYGNVTGSQVLQGETVSQIHFESLQDVVDQVRSQLPNDLDGDSREEIEAELQTIEAQLKSPKPKSQIIRQSLLTVRNLLTGAGGGVLAQLVAKAIGL